MIEEVRHHLKAGPFEPFAIGTLRQLNSAWNGLFFLGSSLFDHDAQPVAGSACDG